MPGARSEPFVERACPEGVCDGSGWILGPEDVARPCACREGRLRKERSKGVASTIPARYRGVSFNRPPVSDMARDLEKRPAVTRVRDFIEELDGNLSAGRGIWFMGDIGTGKTTLAMLISKAALERGHSVAIYSVPKLLARIRQTYEAAPGGDSYSQFFARLTSVDLLHLDDLGAERQNDWVMEQLYAIVNERYESERSVMFTCNGDYVPETKAERKARERLGKEQELLVERQVGPRVFSRLTEMCGDPIVLFGKDYRSSTDLPASSAA